MPRVRFHWRLYWGYAAVILAAVGIVGGSSAIRIERDVRLETKRLLRAEAVLLRDLAYEALATPSLANGGEPWLQSRVDVIGEEIGTRLTIVAADGRVVADSHEDPSRMDNHGSRPEVLAAMAGGQGVSTRFSRTLGQEMSYLALPLEEDGELIAIVRSSLPLTALRSRRQELLNAVVVGAMVAVAIALMLGFLHARAVTEPVESLARAAHAIASGNLGIQVDEQRDDELGALARSFNQMSRELQHSVQAVKADRAKLAAIFSSMIEGLIAVDRDECVLHMNSVAGKLLGVAPEEAEGRRIWEVVRLIELSETLTRSIQAEDEVHRRVTLPGSPDRELELHASPLRAGGGMAAGAVVLIEDVTRLRQLETVRRDFVANVSHELKTPLTTIHAAVETLIDDREMPSDVRESFLSKIQRQSERMANIVTDLLSLARLESDQDTLERVAIDVRDPVLESIRGLESQLEAKDLRLDLKVPEQPVTVTGDEESLIQAVRNLLDNAIKYSPQGSRVGIQVIASESWAIIEVRDQGPGIAPQHRERIFERFYRVDTARSREMGGTGLGLAIVKHIALTLGGRVELESRVGEGSTFRIELPRVDVRD